MLISHQLCSNLIVLTLPLPSVVVQNNPFFPPLLCSLNLLVAFFSFQPHCNWPIISGLIKQNLMTLWEWDVKSKIKKNICAHQLLQGQSYKTGMLVIALRVLPSGYNSCVYGTCVELYVACVLIWLVLCWVVCCLCVLFIAYGVGESHHSCSGHQGLQQVWEEGALPHSHGYKVPPTFLPNTLKSHIGA